MLELFDIVYQYLNPSAGYVVLVVALFVRLSVFCFLLPGLGETSIPARIRLVIALVITWLLLPSIALDNGPDITGVGNVAALFFVEAIFGFVLGFAFRVMVFILQIAGTVIAQALSLSQIFGSGLTEEANPTVSLMLVLAGLTLALTLDLHIEAIKIFIRSYEIFPMGSSVNMNKLAYWATGKASETIRFAIALSLPFVVLNFIYNLMLGVINRAMPQLMVSFVGMPAITGAGLILMALSTTALLTVWMTGFDNVFLDFWG